MSSEYALTVDNKKVWSFFKEKHPSLDLENSILMFIDIMEKLSQDVNTSLNNVLAQQLVDSMKHLQSQVNVVTDNLSTMQRDNINNFTLKFAEFKKDYIEDIKIILSSNVSDKIAPLIREQNDMIMDKTHILINDLIPKNNETLSKQIHESMKNLHSSISEDTTKLLNSTINQKSLDDFIQSLDTKFTTTLSSSQSFYGATEQRLDTSIREIKGSTENNFNSIKELTTNSSQITSSLNNNVSELLKKMEVSSVKGKISENILSNILHSLFPVAQIDSVGTTKETGDVILTRPAKSKILIENKNWDRNVVQEEVKKFIHDVETQNCCGIFLSQNYGIANKGNFEINIHNGNVLVYVHEVNNDAEKIKIAIDIVDHFKLRLDQLDTHSDVDTISKELLDTINQEYQIYISQKIMLTKTIKDFNQKLLKQVEDIQIPSLENYLSTRYATSSSKFNCQYCEFIGKNQQAISAHQRGCSVKKNMTDQKLESIQVETTTQLAKPLMVGDIEIPEITKSQVLLTEKPKKESKKKL
jgi:hypothetical protein